MASEVSNVRSVVT
ncbi:unnamed protein product, partial [Litomosoides sigmodontis]